MNEGTRLFTIKDHNRTKNRCHCAVHKNVVHITVIRMGIKIKKRTDAIEEVIKTAVVRELREREGGFAMQSREMDRDFGGEKKRDEKEDLEVSYLPSNKLKGIYEMKETAFMRRETDR